MMARPAFAQLLAFNIAVITQARGVASAYRQRVAAYGAQVGPHLRHIIEHYEVLLDCIGSGLVDYDHRPRDRSVEQDPDIALSRFAAIIARLEALQTHAPNEALSVGFVVGLDGETFQLCGSTLARELSFVASHAIHHFAIIRPLITAAGIELPEGFGKAPETVRHERLQWAN